MKTEGWQRRRQRSSVVTMAYGLMSCLAIACVTITAVGCEKATPKGTVQGAVTLRGEKLTAGLVCVVSTAGAGALATIEADGSYRFEDLFPVGEYTVWLEPLPPHPSDTPNPATANANATWRKLVPTKYQSQLSSPLKCIVNPGVNEFLIEIAD